MSEQRYDREEFRKMSDVINLLANHAADDIIAAATGGEVHETAALVEGAGHALGLVMDWISAREPAWAQEERDRFDTEMLDPLVDDALAELFDEVDD